VKQQTSPDRSSVSRFHHVFITFHPPKDCPPRRSSHEFPGSNVSTTGGWCPDLRSVWRAQLFDDRCVEDPGWLQGITIYYCITSNVVHMYIYIYVPNKYCITILYNISYIYMGQINHCDGMLMNCGYWYHPNEMLKLYSDLRCWFIETLVMAMTLPGKMTWETDETINHH